MLSIVIVAEVATKPDGNGSFKIRGKEERYQNPKNA
jgi:hypothetical protein